MKRLIASIVLLFIITSYLLSCEKDDLCAGDTPTTPGLVIDFFQNDNATAKETITKLYYYETGSEKRDSITNSSRLILPLKTDAESVKFSLEYVTTVPGQQLPLVSTAEFEVHYSAKQTYLSRACGYKTTYTLIPGTIEVPNPTVRAVSPPPPANPWFTQANIEVITTNIEIEEDDTQHIKIYI